jgi:hypothetical protein
MGEVWLARRPTVGGLAKAVAIKLVPLDQYAPARNEQFLDEARVATLLSHSNIVQVFDIGTAGDVGYLAMEVVDGVDLEHLSTVLAAHGEPMAPRVAAWVVAQILRALDYAHTLQLHGTPLQIVHRDVSPHNVLVSVSGEVKLLDFGIATTMLDPTTGHHVKGKLRYMAPEQFAGRPLDARADLYATGVVMHELLAGTPLRSGSTPAELYGQLVAPTIPPLPRPIPPELEAVRVHLLQPLPEHRCRSATEAFTALTRWPGFTDASAELAQLCRRVTGVAGPRAEVGALADDRGTARTLAAETFTSTGMATTDAGASPEATRRVSPEAKGSPARVVAAAVAVVVLAGVATTIYAIAGRAPSVAEPAVRIEPPSDRASPSAARPAILAEGAREEEHGALASPPRPPPDPPPDDNVGADLSWTSGFCVVDVEGRPALFGYARSGEELFRTRVDPSSGAVLDRQPTDPGERGMLCVDPDLLAVQLAAEDAPADEVTSIRFVRPDGEQLGEHEVTASVSNTAYRAKSCFEFEHMAFDRRTARPVKSCRTSMPDGEVARVTDDGCDARGLPGVELRDGSWIWIDTDDRSASVVVTRFDPRAPPTSGTDPSHHAPRWRKLFPDYSLEWSSIDPWIAASDDLAVFVAKRPGESVVAVWLELEAGAIVTETVVPTRHDRMASAPGFLGGMFVFATCHPATLFALSPEDKAVAWRR